MSIPSSSTDSTLIIRKYSSKIFMLLNMLLTEILSIVLDFMGDGFKENWYWKSLSYRNLKH